MNLIPLFTNELERETNTTRKFLELVPDNKFEWKPHEKSMPLNNLSVHIAEIPGWIETALTTEEVDFADSNESRAVENSEDLVELLDTSTQKSNTALAEADEDDLLPDWTMKNEGQVLMVMPKHAVIRHSLNQITHHRAQLGVYLRLLDIPIPGSYGPSADEQT